MSESTSTRKGLTLAEATAEFWRHPSPWLLAVGLIAAVAARVAVGDWQLSDALVPFAILALFPFLEWVIHVTVLHWRPRRIAGVTLDSQLARKHREHHGNPRELTAVFIPTMSLVGAMVGVIAIALWAIPRTGLGLTFLVLMLALGLAYEWIHYLIHTDYKAKTAAYRAIWQNHRLHHFKNERYWFSVTTSGTSDRVLGTYPDSATVPTSPTAKNLHGATVDGENVGRVRS